MTKVKVCGMTNLADAEHAAAHGAWAIGLIHHPESPRFVEPAVGRGDRSGAQAPLRDRRASSSTRRWRRSIDAAERENLTLLQFHGEEGPSFCTEAARRTGAKVMKALRVTSAADVQAAEAFRIDFHLFDAYWHGIHGGTGRSFDWDLVAKRRSKIPMVAGRRADPGRTSPRRSIA